MRVALVGSDCEENLGLAMIAAALLQEGHQVEVIPFNQIDELPAVTDSILRYRPKMMGLGIQFQHRSSDFLQLARELRQRGYRGHITCGGQYPSMAWVEVLENDPAVDTIVLHEGERSIVDLCDALYHRKDLSLVPGLALRDLNARPTRTQPRALCADLDMLPIAHRYRSPARHLGLAFRPVWGSRGCWGSCAFCAITTYYRDAHTYGGGKKLRLRSVENLAAEMAALWHMEGDATLFCFHDETLLLPRPADSVERLTALRRQLDVLGVGQLGIIGKCRPDCVTPELAKELRRLGVVRMFVGVENGSQRGLDHLGRRTSLQQVEQALSAYEAAGIFVCYNLLIFEPDCVLDDVRANIEFIRRHPHIPVNFCRAEPYHGTPLYHRIMDRGTIMGSYLGWDYRIDDDRAEQAFRIAAAAFRERNFDPEGVANRTMGLGYTAQLLRCFYNVSSVKGQRLLERVDQITRDITLDTAMFLEQAVDIAQNCDLANHDRIARETALLGLRVSAHNRLAHAMLDSIVTDICAFADEQPRVHQRVTIPERARAIFERMALAGCFAASLQACGGSAENDQAMGGTTGNGTNPSSGGSLAVGGQSNTGTKGFGGQVVDMVPSSGGMVADPLPTTGGHIGTGGTSSFSGGRTGTGGKGVGGYVDTVPYSGGRTATGGSGYGGLVVDAVPYSGGRTATGGTSFGGDIDTVPYTGGRTATGGAKTSGGSSYLVEGGSDSVPPSGGRTGTGGRGYGGMVVDAVPYSGGRTATGGRTGTGGNGVGGYVDTLPYPAGSSSIGGKSSTSGTNGVGGFVVDCVVRAGGVGELPYATAITSGNQNVTDNAAPICTVDPAPPQCSTAAQRGQAVVENWRDSGPRRLVRSTDLALSDPPNIQLQAKCEARRVCVRLFSDDTNLTIRWESEGEVQGEGQQVYWTPANEDDALCVAARGLGGITVATLRAADLQDQVG